MTIRYNIVERGNPAKPGAKKKFYPSIQSTGRISLRELAEEASEMSTLTTADTMAAIESLLMIIPRQMAKGNIVELGDLGNLWFHSKSKGSLRPEDVSGKNILGLTARFNAGDQFKQVMKRIKYRKLGWEG
jgi:predicted histone-like DNA-binding protein